MNWGIHDTFIDSATDAIFSVLNELYFSTAIGKPAFIAALKTPISTARALTSRLEYFWVLLYSYPAGYDTESIKREWVFYRW